MPKSLGMAFTIIWYSMVFRCGPRFCYFFEALNTFFEHTLSLVDFPLALRPSIFGCPLTSTGGVGDVGWSEQPRPGHLTMVAFARAPLAFMGLGPPLVQDHIALSHTRLTTTKL